MKNSQSAFNRRSFQLLLALGIAHFTGLLELNLADNQVWYLPGAAEITGQLGTRFSSTLLLTHVGSASVTEQIGFIPYAGKPVPAAVNRALAAGETLRIEGVLHTLFGLSNDAGTLTLNSGAPLLSSLVTANVANLTGTYGLALQPLTASSLLSAGDTGHAIWASQGSGYRTNVALVLLDPNSSVQVAVYDELNQMRGSLAFSSPTPVSWQMALADLIGAPLALGRVEFRVTQGRAAGYTAVVDNVTGDGIAVLAERVDSRVTDFLLDGVARTPGANNTHWSTDVRLFNPNDTTLDVGIDSLGFSSGNSTLTRSVPPLGLIEVVDILGTGGFGYPDGVAGALRFRADRPFLLAGRTSNVDPTGNRAGSFSVFEHAVSYESGFISSPNFAAFAGVNHNNGSNGFRTNLAFLAGSNGASGNLILRDRLGVQEAISAFSFMPGQWIQKSAAEWFLGTGIPADARVDVQLSNGSLDGYASRIDNGTGDPVIIPLALISAGGTSSGPTIAGCPVFPPDNPWNRDISNDSVDANSANYIAHMNGNSKFLHLILDLIRLTEFPTSSCQAHNLKFP